ncbi:MAG: preprotein translocase subunit YajC [Gammaproteobacteria bacterium]|nr:preprotein translocase subunit YajC [Gammaproteobacteria bacterium]
MDFFISSAMAEGGAQSQDGGFMGLLFPFLLLIVFFFLFIRPQQKKVKEQKAMVEALGKGDEVATSGGVIGKITAVGENMFTVQVAEGVELKIQKQAVANLLPKGTMKKG